MVLMLVVIKRMETQTFVKMTVIHAFLFKYIYIYIIYIIHTHTQSKSQNKYGVEKQPQITNSHQASRKLPCLLTSQSFQIAAVH